MRKSNYEVRNVGCCKHVVAREDETDDAYDVAILSAPMELTDAKRLRTLLQKQYNLGRQHERRMIAERLSGPRSDD